MHACSLSRFVQFALGLLVSNNNNNVYFVMVKSTCESEVAEAWGAFVPQYSAYNNMIDNKAENAVEN